MTDALEKLFLRAWTEDGLADQVASSPHASLAGVGLAVGPDVVVRAYGARTDEAHLCRRCQLAIPSVTAHLARGPMRPAASALDALFARSHDDGLVADAIARPREVLAALGLAPPRNVRVVVARSDAGASLELQLCAAWHACLCDAPELEPIVFANWGR